MGSTFVFTMVRDHDVQAPEAIRAWIIAGDILDLHSRAENLRSHAHMMTAEAEVGAFLALAQATRSAAQWALQYCKVEVPIGDAIEKFRPLFQSLSSEFESMLLSTERDRFERIYRDLRGTVNEEQLAHGLARLAFSDHLLSVIGLNLEHGGDSQKDRAGVLLNCARRSISPLSKRRSANISPADQLGAPRRTRIGRRSRQRADPAHGASAGSRWTTDSLLEHFAHERPRQFAEATRLIAETKSTPATSLSALQVVVRSISRLANGV